MMQSLEWRILSKFNVLSRRSALRITASRRFCSKQGSSQGEKGEEDVENVKLNILNSSLELAK